MRIVILGILLSAAAFYIRVKPRLSQKNFGIDSWYFLLCADELRKRRKLPLNMPYFMLDIEEQWYPPVLSIMLSLFPQRLLEKYHWAISALIDTIQMIILYLATYLLTKNLLVASIAALLYATAPLLVTQNATLNSRPLGALILAMTMLSLYGYLMSASYAYLGFAVLLGALLLLTHKLASQQLLFLTIGLSIFYSNPVFLYAFGGAMLGAIILSGGFYLKILKGHIQILEFWKRNLPFRCAHQVYDSPVYKNEGKADLRKGCGRVSDGKFWSYLAKSQFIYLLIAILSYAVINRQNLNPSLVFFLRWFFLTYLCVVIIEYFPPLRFLGESYRYSVYGIFPAALLFSHLILAEGMLIYISSAVLVVFLTMSLLLVGKIHSSNKENVIAVVDDDLRNIIDFVKGLPKDNVMCLPFSHCEHIAYFARKRTLWGAHGYGYDKLQQFFPVLLEPIEYFIDRYRISYSLINTEYVPLGDLRLSVNYKTLMKKGRYCLLEFL